MNSMRHDWRLAEVAALFSQPFLDLLHRAQSVHRAHHEPNTVQMSTLLSIKTGACPEDCAYCPQSVRFDTGLEREALMKVEEVRDAAARAKAAGATRFCCRPCVACAGPRGSSRIWTSARSVLHYFRAPLGDPCVHQ